MSAIGGKQETGLNFENRTESYPNDAPVSRWLDEKLEALHE